MAYSLPHNISLQQLTELQEAAAAAATSSRFGDRPMEADQQQQQQQQASIRHHMLKKTRAAPENQRGEKTSDDSPELDEDEAGGAPEREASNADDEEESMAKEFSEEARRRASSSAAALLTNSGASKQQLHEEQEPGGANPAAPTWLSEAMLRQGAAAAAAAAAASGGEAAGAAAAPNSYSQWLTIPQPAAQGNSTDLGDAHGPQEDEGKEALSVKGFLELQAGNCNSGDLVQAQEQQIQSQQQQQQQELNSMSQDSKLWQNARFKADLVTHPLYEQLLSAHISCLRTATPVDQLPKIDTQLQQSSQVAAKYAMLATSSTSDPFLSKDKDEVNEFMAHYVTLLRSFKETLQQHVRVHAMEAVVACWELEQSLFTLTGVSPGEGTGATMSEDEDEQADCDSGYYDTGMDGTDFTGFGPLIPTETERTLMERVRHELKIELKQGYKAKINDVREEILRKRRAGKLPGDTTSVLKSWWHAHSKWPYPSEDDKARLVQETGLELKQINNWFINQRKRNWHSNPSSSTSLKNKRKR